MIINLFHEGPTATALTNELFAWYSQAAFPIYQPKMSLPTTVADSTLCHVSVTKYMHETKFAKGSDERKTRCAGVAADVARFTAELLNAQADGKFESKYKPAAVVGECMTCHTNDVQGKDDCTPCHGDPHGK